MEKLKTIVDDAMGELDGILSSDQTDKVAKAMEAAIVRGVLEMQNRAVDACDDFSEAEQDIAHKIATTIRQKTDALIVNLSSMR